VDMNEFEKIKKKKKEIEDVYHQIYEMKEEIYGLEQQIKRIEEKNEIECIDIYYQYNSCERITCLNDYWHGMKCAILEIMKKELHRKKKEFESFHVDI